MALNLKALEVTGQGIDCDQDEVADQDVAPIYSIISFSKYLLDYTDLGMHSWK